MPESLIGKCECQAGVPFCPRGDPYSSLGLVKGKIKDWNQGCQGNSRSSFLGLQQSLWQGEPQAHSGPWEMGRAESLGNTRQACSRSQVFLLPGNLPQDSQRGSGTGDKGPQQSLALLGLAGFSSHIFSLLTSCKSFLPWVC